MLFLVNCLCVLHCRLSAIESIFDYDLVGMHRPLDLGLEYHKGHDASQRLAAQLRNFSLCRSLDV